ncbi:peptidoglycan D,D-transpeptidase FtsI family protein [Biformimicrobium ophioploci]|uniref:Peptidoglycan D,D-transpeptidase FtsI n=1 Tax=Biformimicrobium ophioploci TaxID=3036711 RepID=A0ABQ6LX09_9GAMM|nr:penicillin-binding protein 2 [Microbulbifer sp. NKW57]GMG86642.1 peptidoglycan D,D-transpeptidase FtsI [Microbulbifer sp. NKW57]
MGATKVKQIQPGIPRWRFALVAACLVVMCGALVVHLAKLQVVPSEDRGFEFLQEEGRARTLRTESIAAYRGSIVDRNGEQLAVSTPVSTVWANPKQLAQAADRLPQLASALGMSEKALRAKLKNYRNKEFMYLKRRVDPSEAQQVLALDVPGVFERSEYRRYYPAGEVAAHIVGFTDIDDRGQEGMELAFDEWLNGTPGKKRVVKDLKGRVVQDLALLEEAQPGGNLQLTIDLRLQYLAYRELKAAVAENNASSGSMVILDADTGDVLAMVNQPSFNPNDRKTAKPGTTRNRAITDQIEPGSVMKALTMMAALESGRFTPASVFQTSPGWIHIGGKTFKDPVNYGSLDLAGILMKSSQVGTTKLAMELEPDAVRDLFYRAGLGESVGTGFPGESAGKLPSRTRWHPVERANFAFGYGLTVSALQLAQAYNVIANKGVKKSVNLVVGDAAVHTEEQVVEEKVAKQVVRMMTTVTGDAGTGKRARVEGYTVAGKTGTARKVTSKGYSEDRHRSVFAGFIPADEPRLVAAIVVEDPGNEKYHGGDVAAPVFGKVMESAMRMLGESPESDRDPAKQLAAQVQKRETAI